MNGLVKISDLLANKDATLANVMQAVNARQTVNGTIVTASTADVILKSLQNNLPNQTDYQYGSAWFDLNEQRKIDLWKKALAKVALYFGNDKSTSEYTSTDVWQEAAETVVSKYKDMLPFEFEHFLRQIPKGATGEKKEFTSYTVTFLLNLVYDYRIERNSFIARLQDLKDLKERESRFKLTETVSLPNYEKLKGVEPSKMPMHEVIRAKNDKEFTEFFKACKGDKEIHIQSFNLFWKTINDGDGMQPIEIRNVKRLLNNIDNIEVERNLTGEVLSFNIKNSDLRRRYEVCFSKQVLFNFINQNQNGKEK